MLFLNEAITFCARATLIYYFRSVSLVAGIQLNWVCGTQRERHIQGTERQTVHNLLKYIFGTERDTQFHIPQSGAHKHFMRFNVEIVSKLTLGRRKLWNLAFLVVALPDLLQFSSVLLWTSRESDAILAYFNPLRKDVLLQRSINIMNRENLITEIYILQFVHFLIVLTGKCQFYNFVAQLDRKHWNSIKQLHSIFIRKYRRKYDCTSHKMELNIRS